MITLIKCAPVIPTAQKLWLLRRALPGLYEFRRLDSDIADFKLVAAEAIRLAKEAGAHKIDLELEGGTLRIEINELHC